MTAACPGDYPLGAMRPNPFPTDLWQRRFWEHVIRDEADYSHHVNYVHWNPVKHGLVKKVAEWPFSSFHRYVQAGLLPIDWVGNVEEETRDFGENP